MPALSGSSFGWRFSPSCCAIAGYVISKLRGKSVQQEPTASELLTKFRESPQPG